MSSSLERALNKFGKDVVQQSRSRLTKQKKNASRGLYNSIGYDLNVSKNSFSLEFKMEDYGKFIDQGVSGTEKKYNTPFKYTTKAPPPQVFASWAKTRGIKPRDKKTGKFITNKAFGFIISRHIFKQGQKPTKFFTTSFEQQFKRLPDDIVNSFGLDLDNLLDFTT